MNFHMLVVDDNAKVNMQLVSFSKIYVASKLAV